MIGLLIYDDVVASYHRDVGVYDSGYDFMVAVDIDLTLLHRD